LQSSLTAASANLVSLSSTLNGTATVDSKRIDAILTQFQATSVALNKSTMALQGLATDPDLKANIVATTKNIADTTETIAELTRDLRTVTGDPQTQAQIKNTVANLDATMQRANSLLGALGGSSSVYGVDAGATPYPIPSGSPIPAQSPAAGIPAAPSHPEAEQQPQPQQHPAKLQLGKVTRNLFAIQVRMSKLSNQQVCCPSPLFSSDTGPQTDINAIFFPHATTSIFVGAANVGAAASVNLGALQTLSPTLRLGAGLLYSQPGVLSQFNTRVFGIEGRVYDPRRPEVDLIGNLNLTRELQLFFGQRALNHVERRNVYGVQVQFP
jgi:hypothetical protein